MEKRKSRFWIRMLGFFMLIVISFGEAFSAAWRRIRRKWHEI